MRLGYLLRRREPRRAVRAAVVALSLGGLGACAPITPSYSDPNVARAAAFVPINDEAMRDHWAFNEPPPLRASVVRSATSRFIRSVRWGPAEPLPGRAVDCRAVKCVALTFDDGPVGDTARLLNILSRAEISATFFVVGSAARGEPGVLLREVRDGHEVENHSWDHPQLTHLSDEGIGRELDRTADVVDDVIGRRPTLVRPPYGDISRRVVRVIEAPVILWSVDPQDWLYRNADTVYQRVTAQTRPGSIVLMHDIHPTSIDAVPRIIATLKRQHYTFVTVSELYGGRLEPDRVYTGREAEYRGPRRAVNRPAAPAAPATE